MTTTLDTNWSVELDAGDQPTLVADRVAVAALDDGRLFVWDGEGVAPLWHAGTAVLAPTPRHVDVVARALLEADAGCAEGGHWGTATETQRDLYRPMARAVLVALREDAISIYDGALEKTHRGMGSLKPGLGFHEMYSFWVFIIAVNDDGSVITCEGGGHPSNFPDAGKLRHYDSRDEFRRRFTYYPGGKPTYTILLGGEYDVSGWLDLLTEEAAG